MDSKPVFRELLMFINKTVPSVKAVFWTLSIVYISIKLQRFGSWILFRLQVKKKGGAETLAVGPPGLASIGPEHPSNATQTGDNCEGCRSGFS
jgi:hypothetical protein